MKSIKQARRKKIHQRIRRKIVGTQVCPRLMPSKTNRNIYLQLINDQDHQVLIGFLVPGKNQEAAAKAGRLMAEKACKQGISKIVFDRAGYLYHGVVKTISQTAKANGLLH